MPERPFDPESATILAMSTRSFASRSNKCHLQCLWGEEEGKGERKGKEKKERKKGGSVRARTWTVGWDRSSGINGKLPALRFPISLQLRGDELAERRHASRRRLTAKRRVLLERALSVSITQLVRGKVCPANWLIRFARDEREGADPRTDGWDGRISIGVTSTHTDPSNESFDCSWREGTFERYA